MALRRYDMGFLDDLAQNRDRALPAAEQRILRRARTALESADAVVVHIGGKAGRLGEAIVGTAFLEGMLRSLMAIGRQHTPATAICDGSIGALLPASEYRVRYWPEIAVVAAPVAAVESAGVASYAAPARNVLALDFHGAHDGLPSLEAASDAGGTHITTLARLNRVALRSYARRGPEQRYAAFFRDVFRLSQDSLDGILVQPRISLPQAEADRYPSLARAFGLEDGALLVVCFFQSVVAAKCYERWDDMMALLSADVARRFPGRRVNYLVACGPETDQPVHQEDLAAILGGFTGSDGNARVIVAATPSLLDLAVILRHAALALSNDSGPGHLAGALGIPTVTPFLPGTLYSQQVWASTLWHHGVTIEPSPYSFTQLEAEVFAGRTDIINTIPPERLAAAAIACLQGL